MNYKQKAEEYVRKECGLDKLEIFGEVIYKGKRAVFLNYNDGTLDNPLPLNIVPIGSSTKKVVKKEDIEIIGSPIHLEHWLKVLDDSETPEGYYYYMLDGSFHYEEPGRPQYIIFRFDPITGNPATPEDYQKICQLLGVE